MKSVISLLRFELTAAQRSRMTLMFAVGFALATVVLALTGMSSAGVVAIQGFGRTTMSLMQLVLWVVPLVGLLVGASLGAESTEQEFQVSLPVPRSQLLWARWAGWLVVLGGAMTLGLSLAGLVVSASAGSGDGWRYFRLLGVSNLLLAACLAMGLLLGVIARARLQAMGFAIAVWVVIVVGFDLLAIGGLAILPRGQAGFGLAFLLLLNPVDAARSLAIGLLQADLVAGPAGTSIRKLLGSWALVSLALALFLWTVLPLYAAARRFGRLDL